jgi:hypothetical protein
VVVRPGAADIALSTAGLRALAEGLIGVRC